MTTEGRSTPARKPRAPRKTAAASNGAAPAIAVAEPTSKRAASTRGRSAGSRAPGGAALVIVESPAKARTIAQYLGPDYVVESSIGHIRDLPSTAAEIPDNLKKTAWARLGVNVDDDFEPLYIVPATKKAQVSKLKALLKDARELYLATDEDREGEAIAWHLREVLQPRVPVHRMVFHEITRKAINDALAAPRDIDEELVEAQEARRILDRLYGYEVSPVLWKKVKPKLSAGRVQSAAVRLVVERERARMAFVRAGFWDVDAILSPGEEERVPARLVELAGKRIASGRDFDPNTGALTSEAALLDQSTAEAVATALRGQPSTVREVTERPFTQRPPAPFITSTLQQEAGRKLRFTAQRTMRVAQGLYENGYITYMRTDSVNLSTQAVDAARNQVRALYGAEYLPEQPRVYRASRGAQEAHEAVRPAGDEFRTPEQLRDALEGDAFRLYDLIWKRTIAGQMRDATGMRTNVRFEAPAGTHGSAVLTTSGKVITFPGFLRAYVEGSDDPDAELEDQERVLPPLREGQVLQTLEASARGHETQPPARFTEASLVRELEERGIGRPSTYATIIQTIQDRGYVHKRGSALVPNFIAFAVTRLLEEHFPELVDLDFTARMEGRLDAVAAGDLDARPWLREFYFGGKNGGTTDEDRNGIGLKARIAEGLGDIDAREVSSIPLGNNASGRAVAVRVGRYGPYVQIEDSDEKASIPDDTVPDEITLERALELIGEAALGDRALGTYPPTGEPIYVKTGRFGPYVQVGEDDSNGGKPKRGSLFPGIGVESVTLEDALEILSFPKELGVHPETGEVITAQDGPNGPYLRMGKDSRSLRDHDHLRSVDLADAIRVFAEPKRGRSFSSSVLRELGEHPDSKAPLRILKGRFGPYVTDGRVNASLPSGRDPATLEVDDALELLAAREARLREQGIEPGTKAPARRRAATPSRTPRRRSA